MPFLRIVSNNLFLENVLSVLKSYGSLLGYTDPRKVWIEVSSGLSQDDVIFVEVKVETSDFEKPEFPNFCKKIAEHLRFVSCKSVEVVVPTNTGIECVAWAPTVEGSKIYTD